MEIAGQEIPKGSVTQVLLPLPPLYTQDALHMAVTVVRGRRPGPTVLVTAAIHGDEINGIEIVRRVLLRKNLRRLRGTLIAVPVVNSYGVFHRERYLPDGRDLNRCFPGNTDGSLASRIAKLLTEEVVRAADYVIDLHTATRHRTNLPQVRIDADNAPAERLARCFGAPVILKSRVRPGSLRAACAALDIPMMTYEAGEALRHDRGAIRAGVAGVLAVLSELEMLSRPRRGRDVSPYVAQSSQWVRATASGILIAKAKLGERVQKDQVLGEIVEPTGTASTHIYAPQDGIVISTCVLPLVYEGEAIYHLAFFAMTEEVEAEVESFNEEFDVT